MILNGWIALALVLAAAALGWYTVRTRDGRRPAEHLRPYRRPVPAVYAASVARRARERAERAMKADRAWASWAGTEPTPVLQVLASVEAAPPFPAVEPEPPIFAAVAAEVGSGTRLVTRWQAAVACYQLGGPLDTLCAEFDVELQRLAEGVAA